MKLLSIILMLSAAAFGQTWSGILDPTRATTDWTSVGIPGGIPTSRTQCGTTITATGSDQTSAINTSLSSCATAHPLTANSPGDGGYVLLANGTFVISGQINVPSNVTLRGTSAHGTILSIHGSPVALGANDFNFTSNAVNITSGTGAGSTSIVVSSATNYAVGKLVYIDELNDASFVNINGCTWCDEFASGTRVRRQISEVTSVNGTTIGIKPGLYYGYTHTPHASVFTSAVKYGGLESIQVYANNSGSEANIDMKQCQYCWLKGVESNFCDNAHVLQWYSYHNEIRDSYFHDAFKHVSGTADSDVWIGEGTTGSLIENNIAVRMHLSIDLNRGPSGNVVAYNYTDGDYDTSATNVLLFDMAMHGSHHQMNLWEGNVFDQIRVESYWGSGSWETLFRNWAVGITNICLPYSARGAAGACHVSTQGNDAIEVDFLSYKTNLVGNVSGSAALKSWAQGAGGSEVTYVAANEGRSNYGGNGYDFGYGYYDVSDSTGSGTCTGARSACLPFYTSLTHGNYTNGNSTTAWEYNVPAGHNPAHPSQTLPPSFYKSAKPTWWGNTIPWPAIGPDVTGGTGPGGHASLTASNPAMACYVGGSKDANGYLIFNPSTCYSASGPSAPTVTTTTATSITTTTASAGGVVTSNGGASVTSEGTCYATTANPTSPCTSNGTATPFTSSISGLTQGTLYHYRAFATNSVGTAYGNDLTFTTLVPFPAPTGLTATVH